MKAKVVLIIVALLISGSLLAQTPGTVVKLQEKPSNRIGLAASSMSGIGFSYLHLFGPVGAKLTGIGWYSETSGSSESYLFTSGGIELQYTVYETKIARFYPLLGFNVMYTEEKQPQYYYSYPDPYTGDYRYPVTEQLTSSKTITRRYTGGIGIGCELLIARIISFNGEIGYQFTASYTTNSGNNYYYYSNVIKERTSYLGIGGGIGASIAF